MFGLSANLMSLGGLAIAIGMIVDSAIVVTENAVQRLDESKSHNKLHIIYRAACEVALPTAAGTLIICFVFLPLLTLEGLEGKLFSPVALAIVFALGSAIFLAFTLIPVLAAIFLKAGSDRREALIMRMIIPTYERLLNLAIRTPSALYLVALLSVIAAGISYINVGKSFMPTMNEGAVVMQLSGLPSINLAQSEADDLRIEAALLERVPEVSHIISRVGSDELGLDPMSLNESDMFLELAPRSEWRGPDTEWLVNEMRTVMADFIGIETAFTQPIEMRVSELLTGSGGDLAIKIYGADAEVLAGLAGEIEKVVASVEGATEVFTTSNDVAEYLQVDILSQRAGRFGLDATGIQNELRARLEGVHAGEVIEPDRRTPILIRSDKSYRDSLYGFEDIKLVTPTNQTVRLFDVASVERAEGLASVERENGSRYAVVEAFVAGRDLVGFVEDAQLAVAQQIDFPPGYRVNFGGEFENQRRAAARLLIMIPISIGLIFVVLFATLRSLRQAILILCNIPFALVGGIIALSLSGQYLSVPASVGFIALLGIAVLNGLVLITYFNDLRALGVSIEDTIRQGSVRRLRPVLMTATTAAFGLIPLLFSSGPGSEIQKPLAIVVIGGLISSTLLTLFLLPLLYRRFGVENETGSNENTKEVKWIHPYAN
jgi:cobalt-zinc-cadmium resistance protein CzcA